MGRSARFLRDSNGVPIPVLAPDTPARVAIAVAATYLELTLNAPDTPVVQISCSQGMYWKFATSGSDAVTATTGFYFPAGTTREYHVPEGITHVSVIHGPEATDGFCTVQALR